MDKKRKQNKINDHSQKRNEHNQKNNPKQGHPQRPQQESRIQADALEANQIRNLIRNNGRLAVGNCEYILRQPSSNDLQIHDIIRDPAFTARQAEPFRNASESRYELRSSNNRTAQITIDCKPNTRT